MVAFRQSDTCDLPRVHTAGVPALSTPDTASSETGSVSRQMLSVLMPFWKMQFTHMNQHIQCIFVAIQNILSLWITRTAVLYHFTWISVFITYNMWEEKRYSL